MDVLDLPLEQIIPYARNPRRNDSEVVLIFRTRFRLGLDASGVCSCRFSYLCVAEVCDVRNALIKGCVRAL